MLQRVSIEGIKLPKLYIAENMDDVRLAKSKGIPYVRWDLGMTELIRQMLRPTLEKMFPRINWNNILGERKKFKTKVMAVDGWTLEANDLIDDDYDNSEAIKKQQEYIATEEDHEVEHVADIATSKREFLRDNRRMEDFYHTESIETFVGDLSSYVNIEVLQNLNLLPKFIGDIVDCIKINLSNNMRWREGYNKKRGVPIGTFGNSTTLPNLIILDVSGSIPRGISATMLTLIDTMRTELDADLIITSDRSVYYPHGSKLPCPQSLRDYFGYGNEAEQFYKILKDHVAGRKWGHVISFGDYDCPVYYDEAWGKSEGLPTMEDTSVMAVHHYHTWASPNKEKEYIPSGQGNTKRGRTGYAEWVHVVNPLVEEHYDNSWCNAIKPD